MSSFESHDFKGNASDFHKWRPIKGTIIRGTQSGLPRCNSEEHRNIGLTKPCGKDDQVNVGGKTLDKAWVYDGNQWNDLKPMSITRDRPACSLAQFDDGSVRMWKLEF